ncbi:MAG TPA: TonB-dependent receptor [Ignavibacteria bacterium]|nr:TonB-dependent receptor [Ignavibacteria bacterium]
MNFLFSIFTLIFFFSNLTFSQNVSSSGNNNPDDSQISSKDTLFFEIPGIEIIGIKENDLFKYSGVAYATGLNEINLIQPTGTEELLRRIPGFNIASDDGISNRMNVGIRGLYPRRSSRVLIMEDGVPVNPTLYIDPATYYNSPSDRLDGLEVIKGSSGLKYGPLTMGGVVNYLTNRPPQTPNLHLKLSGGNNDYYSTYVTYGGTYDKTGLEVQGLFKNFGGFRQNTSSKTYDLTFKGGYQVSEKVRIGTKINFFQENSNSTYSGLTQYSFNTDPYFNPKKFDQLDAQRYAVDINSEFVINKDFTVYGTLYGNQYNRNWWREDDKFVTPDGNAVTSGYNGPIVRVGNGKNVGRLRTFRMAGLELKSKINHNLFNLSNYFEFGVRVHNENFKNNEIKGDTSFSRSGTIDKDEYFSAFAFSTFIQNNFNFGNVNIAPGVRFENFNQTYRRYYNPVTKKSIDSTASNNTFELLPGVSINYLTDRVNLFAGIHRGFTPSTIGTAFLNSSSIEILTGGDANLEAEKSWNTEIGIKSYATDWMFVEGAYFRMDISNLVDAGRDAIFQNLGKVRIQGVESAVSFDISNLTGLNAFKIILDGNYTYLNSEIVNATVIERPVATSSLRDTINVSGNETPYSPKHTIQTGIEFKLPVNLDLRFEFRYTDKQFTDFANTVEESPDATVGILPAYRNYNVSARYKIPAYGLALHFAVKNLTNEIYRGSRINRTSSGLFPDGFRQFIGSIELNF